MVVKFEIMEPFNGDFVGRPDSHAGSEDNSEYSEVFILLKMVILSIA